MYKKILLLFFMGIFSISRAISQELLELEQNILSNSNLTEKEKEELNIIFELSKQKCSKGTNVKKIEIYFKDIILKGNINKNTLQPIGIWNLYRLDNKQLVQENSFCLYEKRGYILRNINDKAEYVIETPHHRYHIIYNKNKIYQKINITGKNNTKSYQINIHDKNVEINKVIVMFGIEMPIMFLDSYGELPHIWQTLEEIPREELKMKKKFIVKNFYLY